MVKDETEEFFAQTCMHLYIFSSHPREQKVENRALGGHSE